MRLPRFDGPVLSALPNSPLVASLLELGLSVRDCARRDAAAAERVARVDERRLTYLRPLFAEFCDDEADVEGRCLLVLTPLVGESLVTATHGARTRPAVAAAAVRHLLR